MKDTHDMQTENSDLTDIIHLLLERKLVQSAPQLIGFALSNAQSNAACIVKLLTDDTCLHLFHDVHHLVHHWITEIKRNDFFHLPQLYCGMCKGIRRCRFISNYQPTCA